VDGATIRAGSLSRETNRECPISLAIKIF